ncbi:N-acetylglucosaminyl transferase [Erysipelotrichaceae bacterium]|nr:N-acetylglucosaminyl transferase [Erysipelotrichaceae bacterium]
MRYILTGGGSGGHIYPLLSFAKMVQTLDADAEFLFVGKKGKLEEKIVPKAGIPFKSLYASGTKGKVSLENILAAGNLAIGYFQAQKIIKDFKPDFCIGAGGYVSVPLMLAANNDPKVITAVFENDQFIGRANLKLSQKSDFIFGGMFDLKAKYFKNKPNYLQVGHPRTEELSQEFGVQIQNKAQRSQKHPPSILFIGGSLGAEKINEQAIAYCKYIIASGYTSQIGEIVLITGIRYYEQMRVEMEQYSFLKVIAYSDNLPNLYLACDILVSRAGAGVLAEATAFEIPTLLIPSPNVTNNHQFHNASYFAKYDAVQMMEENDIDGESFIAMLHEVVVSIPTQQRLSNNLKKLQMLNASSKMYEQFMRKKME